MKHLAVISATHVIFLRGGGDITRKLAGRYLTSDERLLGGAIELIDESCVPGGVKWGKVYPHFSPHEVGFEAEVQVVIPKPARAKKISRPASKVLVVSY